MASVKLVFKKDKARKNGEVPLYLRIIKDRKSRYVALGVKVHPDNWDEENQRVTRKHPNSQRVNAMISKKLAEAESLLLDQKEGRKVNTSNRLKTLLSDEPSPSFLSYFEKHLKDLEKNGKIGSLDKAKATYSKLKTYQGNRDLLFEDVTVGFLKRYESYLRDELENSTNTIHSNLKIFRKLFNDASRDEVIRYEENPFLRFKLKWEKTKKEFLTEEELEQVENLELKPGTKRFHHRNMYVFSCYAAGMRISDVLQLKWDNLGEDRITIQIHKTKEPLSFKLPKKALEIINLYKGSEDQNGFIFPILKADKDYSDPKTKFNAISSATAYINKDLRWIASKIGLSHTMSFHSSRHTWATRALRKGMRIEYVSKLLGHANIKTTQIYAKIVNSELDKAMEVFDE